MCNLESTKRRFQETFDQCHHRNSNLSMKEGCALGEILLYMLQKIPQNYFAILHLKNPLVKYPLTLNV